MRTALALAFAFHFLQFSYAQEHPANTIKDQISIMVLPHNPFKQDVLEQIEKNPGYKEALLYISGALIDMGYTNTLDIQTFLENVQQWGEMTNNNVYNDKIKLYIQDAPADIIIDVEILWDDPVGNPQNRQISLSLKAVDKYNSRVYATSISVRSAKRAYPDLKTAVALVLRQEGASQFKIFLSQLDSSYSHILAEGRIIKMKFEIDGKQSLHLNDRVNGIRISDKIEQCIRDNVWNGKYEIKGESDCYIEVSARIPVVTADGAIINLSQYLRRKIDDCLFDQKLHAEFSIVGSWLNFKLTGLP